uniref:Uncharacterized protein n=1 Tax=Siphoviridae sp. ctCIv11 TaxID=2827806 RepID=A0A8S5S2X1_9CAUD|nr:MAG TPA: hypothetical protein [Siphoviridae sp. ctCIv11]
MFIHKIRSISYKFIRGNKVENRIDELIKEYKIAVKNNEEIKIKELERFFEEEIGLTSFGLQIVAFG